MPGKSGPAQQSYGAGQLQRGIVERSNYHPHGELYANSANTVTVVCTLANTYYQAAGFQEGPETDAPYVVLDGAAGSITIGNLGKGIYLCYIGASFRSSRNNVTIHGDLWVSGVDQVNIGWQRDIGTANQIGDANSSGLVSLDPGDILTYRFESDTAATTLTLEHADFWCMKIGG